MTKRYYIEKEDCSVTLQDFFCNVATIAGCSVSLKTKFDCRKINVSESVKNVIYDEYIQLGLSSEQIDAIWVMFGPKANIDSKKLVVEIEDGFILSEGE